MNRKHLALWVFLALLVLLAFVMVGQQNRGRAEEISFSALHQAVVAEEVKTITFQGEDIRGTFADGRSFHTIGPPVPTENFLDTLEQHDLVPNYEKIPAQGLMASLLVNGIPLLLILFLFIFFMRQLQAGGGKAMSFGKSRARLLSENGRRMTFDDVAGVNEAKEDLEEIIEFLKEPRKFTRLGGRIPKGVLLMGPPGTGKTLLARAIAGEAGVPFYLISGSDFVEMFVGVGASRVRDLFEQAKKNAPCIVFIDEIDAVGRHRGAGLGGGHDEREQTLNQLLVEMDGFESTDGVILVAATNRPDVLDPALLRPGRFDRRIVVPRPDINGRKGILAVHTRRTPLSDDVDLARLARGTPGFSGADLENLVNEAALQAARFGKDKVEMSDFEAAKDKVSMGKERRSMVISEDQRKRTAYHETGHALVAYLSDGADPVHKISIIPRGMALGLTQMLPDEDRYSASKQFLETRIAIFMGGRVAEELVFDEISTGASDDLRRATGIARSIVAEYGMTDALGPVTWADKQDQVFLGREIARRSEVSEHTSRLIDDEVRRIVTEGYVGARKLLLENLHVLHKVSQVLLERETLDHDELTRIVDALEPIYPGDAEGVA